MAVDNPSYFSLRAGDSSANIGSPTASSQGTMPMTRSLGGLFRRNKSSNKITSNRYAREQPRSPITSVGCQRRSFRNLFRSASASADCEKTRQFLKGEPRPSDVAPPSPYLNSRSHAHSESGRCKVARRRLPKSTSELLNVDMIFCGLSSEGGAAVLPRRTEDNDYYRFERNSECGSEATVATLPLDDIEDARSYYNLTATFPSLLCHVAKHESVGRSVVVFVVEP
ncbi:PREDICTED: uncharacterized protein LOC105363543 [Ceratosolen solmsi marchali]|uniref:Uncharacterized protein LOC105363543 n=1 Tax=Ceratosolen solmsi marchali TaxID=326594 RepID=A0AAJ7DX18_9HYME|nr:PREDICTED: uncharacterized protein LOC105363543 [Ceratosolen solmsi marchali]